MIDTRLSIDDVTEALAAQEPVFHRLKSGASRADFDAMMAPEFWEIGASGRRYSREFILETLVSRYSKPVIERLEVTNFRCQELAPNLYLVSYELDQSGRLSQRTTIWRRQAGAWQVVFHQGTLVS